MSLKIVTWALALSGALLYLLCIWRPPLWLWKRLLGHVRASTEPQKLYPRTGHVLRTAYLTKRAISHLVKMDFSAIPGRSGYIAWRIGLIGLWRKRFTARMPRPPRPEREIAKDIREGLRRLQEVDLAEDADVVVHERRLLR